jgi:hypothetical protein
MGIKGSKCVVGLVAAIVGAVAMAGVGADANAGAAWSKPVTLGPIGRDSGEPELAVGPDGEAVAVWEGGRPEGIRVSSRRPGHGWSRPALIRGSSESELDVAVTRRKAVVVWGGTIRPQGSEAYVAFAATRLRGGRWSKPENISAEKRWRYEPEGTEPDVAITKRGEAIAMWTARDEGHSTTPFIKSSTQPLGEGWSSPVGIRGSIEGEEPQVEVTPNGEAVAVWHAFYNEESGLETASRPAGGRKWSGVKRLTNPGAFPEPQLAITPTGEPVAVWSLELGEGLQVATRNSDLRWGVKTFMATRAERFNFPQIVTGPGGAAALVWTRDQNDGGEDVAVSFHPRGGEWSEPASLFGPEIRGQRPAVALTRGGEWIAVWKSALPGGGSMIQASSRRPGQSWSPPVNLAGSPIAPLPGSSRPEIAVAANGEAFAVWQRYDGSSWVVEAATRRR